MLWLFGFQLFWYVGIFLIWLGMLEYVWVFLKRLIRNFTVNSLMLCFLFVFIIWRQLNVLSQYVWVHISKSTLLLCCDLHASIYFWLRDAKMWKLFLQIHKRQVHIKLRAECYHCFPMAWSDPPQWGVRSKTVNSVQNYQHCTVYNVQCTIYNVQCTVYNVQCTMYSVQCTVYNV